MPKLLQIDPTNAPGANAHALREKALAELAATQQVRATCHQSARTLRETALRNQRALAQKLPALARAVETATEPQARVDAQRAYLQARQSHDRNEKIYQRASRQLKLAAH